MTREEITKRIEEIENAQFMLNMKNFWNWKDRERNHNYSNELFNLKKQLKEMGGE